MQEIVAKSRIALCLVSLNYRAKELQLQWLRCGDPEEKALLRAQTQELYDLKSAVIIKLMREGHARVMYRRERAWGVFYLIGVGKWTFHCPETPGMLEAVRKYNV